MNGRLSYGRGAPSNPGLRRSFVSPSRHPQNRRRPDMTAPPSSVSFTAEEQNSVQYNQLQAMELESIHARDQAGADLARGVGETLVVALAIVAILC